jgi:hypothetical protein
MDNTRVTTPKGRVSFPHLYTPRASEPGKPEKYSVVLLIPKTENIGKIVEIRNAAVSGTWPDAAKRPKNLHNPIKDGDTDVMADGSLRKDKYPEVAGHWIISASRTAKSGRPKVVDPNMQEILDEGDLYAGCYARMSIHAFAYQPSKTNPQSKYGVSFGLNNVQKLEEGESFSGQSKPEDDFEPVPGASAPVQATKTDGSDMFS